MKDIRIFVSSPGDVLDERERARTIIESLQRRYSSHRMVPLLWEDLPLQPDMSFQQGIDAILSKKGVDIAVFILWSRLGSPTGPISAQSDGETFRSGTEREFRLMLEARERTREKGEDIRPDLLIYTRSDDVSFDERLRGKNLSEKRDLLEQRAAVEEFLVEEFRDAESDTNLRAYHSYDRPPTFSQRLRVHLEALIDQRVERSSGVTIWDVDAKGIPYPGLAPYDFEHAKVFFGREDETIELRRLCIERARAGCAFVLVSGASGSGKSSLVRAGLIPEIVTHELDEEVSGWNWIAFRPAEFGADLFGELTSAFSDSLSLELSEEERDDLASSFSESPQSAFDLVIKPRLTKASSDEANRLILLVDQLEEIFTDSRIDPETRSAFARLLEVFARGGLIWVVATIRSDFAHRCQEVPSLLSLKHGGEFDLVPPTSDGVARVIREPMRLAGYQYESREGSALDDMLLREAVDHRELLPFLCHVLSVLAEHHRDHPTVTFETWDKVLGGDLRVALGQYAENAFQAATFEAQGTLPLLLPSLIALSDSESAEPVRRYAPLSELNDSSSKKELVSRLIEARLFTSSGIDESTKVSVAHEALLRSWERISSWLEENREILRIRRNVETAYRRWCESGESIEARDASLLLPAGLPLAEGERIVADQSITIDEAHCDFVERSSAVHLRRERRRRRLRGVVMAGGVTLLVALLTVSEISRRKIGDSLTVAQQAKTLAELQRSAAEAMVKRRLDPHAALEQVREVVEDPIFDSYEIPDSIRASMADVLQHSRQATRVSAPDPQGFSQLSGISSRGNTILSHFRNGLAIQPLVSGGKRKPFSGTISSGVSSLAFHEDSEDVFLGYRSGMIQRIRLEDEKEIHRSEKPGEEVIDLLQRDGRLLVIRQSGQVEIRNDSLKVELQGRIQNPERFVKFHLTDDRARFLGVTPPAIDTSVTEFELKPNQEVSQRVVNLSPGRGPVTCEGLTGAFAVGFDDGRIGFRNFAGDVLGSDFVAFSTPVDRIAVSPDGSMVAAASRDREIGVWRRNGTSRTPILVGHVSPILELSFSENGEMLTSFDEGHAHVWDLDGLEVSPPLLLSATAHALAFHPSGERFFAGLTSGDLVYAEWETPGDFEVLPIFDDGIGDLAVDSNGRYLVVTATGPEGFAILDLESMEVVYRNADPQGSVVKFCGAHRSMPYGLIYFENGKVIRFSTHDELLEVETKPLMTKAGSDRYGVFVESDKDSLYLLMKFEPVQFEIGPSGEAREVDAFGKLVRVSAAESFQIENEWNVATAGMKLSLFSSGKGKNSIDLVSSVGKPGGVMTNSLHHSSTGQTLAILDEDGAIAITSESLTPLIGPIAGHPLGGEASAMHPHEPVFVTAGKDRLLKFWAVGGDPWKAMLRYRSRQTVLTRDFSESKRGALMKGLAPVSFTRVEHSGEIGLEFTNAGLFVPLPEGWSVANEGLAVSAVEGMLAKISEWGRRFEILGHFSPMKEESNRAFWKGHLTVVHLKEFEDPTLLLGELERAIGIGVNMVNQRIPGIHFDSSLPSYRWVEDPGYAAFEMPATVMGSKDIVFHAYWRPVVGNNLGFGLLAEANPEGVALARSFEASFANAIVDSSNQPEQTQKSFIGDWIAEAQAEAVGKGLVRECQLIWSEIDKIKEALPGPMKNRILTAWPKLPESEKTRFRELVTRYALVTEKLVAAIPEDPESIYHQLSAGGFQGFLLALENEVEEPLRIWSENMARYEKWLRSLEADEVRIQSRWPTNWRSQSLWTVELLEGTNPSDREILDALERYIEVLYEAERLGDRIPPTQFPAAHMRVAWTAMAIGDKTKAVEAARETLSICDELVERQVADESRFYQYRFHALRRLLNAKMEEEDVAPNEVLELYLQASAAGEINLEANPSSGGRIASSDLEFDFARWAIHHESEQERALQVAEKSLGLLEQLDSELRNRPDIEKRLKSRLEFLKKYRF